MRVVSRLDELIAITKLANRNAIENLRQELEKDPVSVKALKLADGSMPAGEFRAKIVAETGVSDVTVQRRIASLVDLGVLNIQHKGGRSYYELSGLIEV